MHSAIAPVIVGLGTPSRLEIHIGEIETYYSSVRAQISITDRWIQVHHQPVWFDRAGLKRFVDQVSTWAHAREIEAHLEGMSPKKFTLDLSLHGRARDVRVGYSLQTMVPDEWGPITHMVSGVFDLNMEYLLQLIDDVKRIFMQLEHIWASA